MVIISTTILVKSDSTFPLSYISVGIFFVNITHVGAKSALLRRLFVPAAKKTSSARSLAHPFQIEPAVLGFDLGMGADWRAAASILLDKVE